MANAFACGENSFLSQIDRTRAELIKKVARAHQVLQEREAALLSELQKLEDSYREERKLETNLETTKFSIRQVELKWNTNLNEILIRIGKIRVRKVREYKISGQSTSVADKLIEDPKESSHEYETALSFPTTLLYNSSSSKCNFLPNYSNTSHKFEGNPSRGLRNLGSTCYMNSILQCLSHTLPLREFYVSDEYKQFLNKRGDLSSAFKRVMLELWDSTSQHSVDPYDLRREVKARTDRFPVDRQHDAHGFMGFLLNELHEGINRASVEGRKSPADNETLREACARHLTWEDSRISELFGGMLRSEVCCSVCSDKSIVYIPFMDIALPIQEEESQPKFAYFCSPYPCVQLVDCFKLFETEVSLTAGERPYCNKCSNLTNATKQISRATLPKLFTIQLKRFSFHPKRTKLSMHVKFEEAWSLKDCHNDTHIYSLYGIVCHSGSIYGGHYVAYCKYNETWRCYNDSITTKVIWEHVKNQEAYILFYYKLAIL